MTAKQLKNINNSVRKMINDHLTKTGTNLASFSKECGLHQSQMWMYLNDNDQKKGLHTSTLEKIGRYLDKMS